jgi:hypothetical protein
MNTSLTTASGLPVSEDGLWLCDCSASFTAAQRHTASAEAARIFQVGVAGPLLIGMLLLEGGFCQETEGEVYHHPQFFQRTDTPILAAELAARDPLFRLVFGAEIVRPPFEYV